MLILHATGMLKKRRVCNTKNVCKCNFQMHDCEAMNAWNKTEKKNTLQGKDTCLKSLAILLEVARIDQS